MAALEEAAGGTAVADAVVAEVAQAAAEIGVEPGTPFAGELAGRLDEVGLARNGRPEPAPPPLRTRLARVPPWAWLVALVVVSAVFRYGLSRRVVAPWIMVDELIYSELAKSFAATGHFLIRDVAPRRLRRGLSAADRSRVARVRLGAGRLRGGEDDRLGADVAHRDPRLLPRASRALAAVVAARRRCSPSRCRR